MKWLNISTPLQFPVQLYDTSRKISAELPLIKQTS